MENSVVPSNEMEANQTANPESGEVHNQHEEARTERVISIVDSLENRFRTLMESDAPGQEEDKGHKPFIGRIPMFLRKKTKLEKYFTPSIVSIGHPVYGGLEQGHQFKLQLAKLFIGKNPQKKEIIYNILKEIESFKECYNQQDDQRLTVLFELELLNDEDLAWMFFVDGCALIQLVINWGKDELFDIAADQMKLLRTDLLLLENQLPLRVLNLVMGFRKEEVELYQKDDPVGEQSKEFRESISKESKESRQSICESIQTITNVNFRIWKTGVTADSVTFNRANHLLELIWMNLVKKEIDSRSDITKTTPGQFYSTVKDLQAVGIILEPNNSASSLRDISFNRGTVFCKLKIPRFRFSEQGKILLFNLIAFEMHPNFKRDLVVTSYISFLNSLIETKEDVAELRKAGILLTSPLKDEEVLTTFQDFTSSLKPYPYIFSSIDRDLFWYFFY